MTIEEYNKLKQRVINLRQSTVSEQGSASHAKIWEELRELEHLLENAQIEDNLVEQNINSKLQLFDNKNIIQKPLKK